jgi:hypothetical protein
MKEMMTWRNVIPQKPAPRFEEICGAMKSRTHITLTDARGYPVTGLVNRIEAEDGSGRCWNVTISHGIHTSTVFVRTV